MSSPSDAQPTNNDLTGLNYSEFRRRQREATRARLAAEVNRVGGLSFGESPDCGQSTPESDQSDLQ